MTGGRVSSFPRRRESRRCALWLRGLENCSRHFHGQGGKDRGAAQVPGSAGEGGAGVDKLVDGHVRTTRVGERIVETVENIGGSVRAGAKELHITVRVHKSAERFDSPGSPGD